MRYKESEKVDFLVDSLNISEKKGTIKTPVESSEITELGLSGDAHAGTGRRVSLLSVESIREFSKAKAGGRQFKPGEFAENITTKGIDFSKIAVFDRLKIGDTLLEITQIGKKCHGDGCAIFREVGTCVMPKEGVFAKVLSSGTVKREDRGSYTPAELMFKVITLSDRASKGEYEDRSGPEIESKLHGFFENRRWQMDAQRVVIPDEADLLESEIEKAVREGVDMIFTTGGTGVGPRDITPDVVERVSDRLIPGIMESIRVRCGEKKPNALLSRSVAGVKGNTVIYTLPGSVKAVREYMDEIFRNMEHLILMLAGQGH